MNLAKSQPARRVVALALTAGAEQVVTRVKQETGITQVAFLERLLEWYATQDPLLRTMILSPYPTVRKGLARLLLEGMQSDPGKDSDARPRFDALIDHDFESEAKPPAAASGETGRSKSVPRGVRSSKRGR